MLRWRLSETTCVQAAPTLRRSWGTLVSVASAESSGLTWRRSCDATRDPQHAGFGTRQAAQPRAGGWQTVSGDARTLRNGAIPVSPWGVCLRRPLRPQGRTDAPCLGSGRVAPQSASPTRSRPIRAGRKRGGPLSTQAALPTPPCYSRMWCSALLRLLNPCLMPSAWPTPSRACGCPRGPGVGLSSPLHRSRAGASGLLRHQNAPLGP